MMNTFVWWVGAFHLIVYGILGAVAFTTYGTVKLHMHFKVMGRIIQWHRQRARDKEIIG